MNCFCTWYLWGVERLANLLILFIIRKGYGLWEVFRDNNDKLEKCVLTGEMTRIYNLEKTYQILICINVEDVQNQKHMLIKKYIGESNSLDCIIY